MSEIDKPNWYKWIPGVECVTVAANFDFLSGSAIKYIWRAGKKPGNEAVRDLQKARRMLLYRIRQLETGKIVPEELEQPPRTEPIDFPCGVLKPGGVVLGHAPGCEFRDRP